MDDRKRAEPVRVTPMNRRAEKDALHAPTEKCVRVWKKRTENTLDTAGVVRDTALIRI